MKKEEDGKYNDLLAKLADVELLAENRDLSVEESQNRINWKKELAFMDEERLRDFKQKAKVKWLVDGDENSTFFHGMVNNHLKASRINGLMLNGLWEVEPNTLKQEIFKHFSERFSETSQHRPEFVNNRFRRLPQNVADELIVPFSVEEIKRAVWEGGGDKSPGPDGYNFNFLKRFWDLMAGDLNMCLTIIMLVGL